MRVFVLGILALFLGGCIGIADIKSAMGKDVREWVRYVENNGTLSEMSFYEVFSTTNKKIVGEAIIKVPTKFSINGKDFNYLSSPVGDIYELNDSIKVIFKDIKTSKSIDIYDRKDMGWLGEQSEIKIYEFGNGMIETIVYNSGKMGVCEAFVNKKVVNATSATNYFVDKKEFFTTLANVDLVVDRGFEVRNLDFKFFVGDKNLDKVKSQATSADFRTQVINRDFLKQGRLLLNILCYDKFLSDKEEIWTKKP